MGMNRANVFSSHNALLSLGKARPPKADAFENLSRSKFLWI
jgi:hypothetical protein